MLLAGCRRRTGLCCLCKCVVCGLFTNCSAVLAALMTLVCGPPLQTTIAIHLNSPLLLTTSTRACSARPTLPCPLCSAPHSHPQDLQEVSAKWAVSSIQLRFSFMRGLHPFYPPRLEVVRPHLAAPLPGALASHPLLTLDHWDSCMNMSQLLERIKEFLEVGREVGCEVDWKVGCEVGCELLFSMRAAEAMLLLLLFVAAHNTCSSVPLDHRPCTTCPRASALLLVLSSRCVAPPCRSGAAWMWATLATALLHTPTAHSARCRWHWLG